MKNSLINADKKVVLDFGAEWARFDQSELTPEQGLSMFDDYFRVFPWHQLPDDAIGMDVGCGSGRWALFIAPKVGKLFCIDASSVALDVARHNLRDYSNIEFHLASVESLPVPDGSMDFAYSLGVLHHVPETAAAVKSVARILKPGAPVLLYLYYAFDNRPFWFKMLWQVSDMFRRMISGLPTGGKHLVCEIIAGCVYWPVARLGYHLNKFKKMPASWPLAYYRDKSFYSMRTDALDRFGTRLEKRFTQEQIRAYMLAAGLTGIVFSDQAPFWCVVGYKK